ncbi:histidine kinase [Cellulomonas sp.]|uniref:sensor histidine kinase n=1 Tax=Cellulomonas sp. TaxID=40001 RepID=UPI00258EB31B|nr:histidine kinase [Cellulomonas sp.]MCR6689081.1 histidine kinase [Cellulomonas sp.]
MSDDQTDRPGPLGRTRALLGVGRGARLTPLGYVVAVAYLAGMLVPASLRTGDFVVPSAGLVVATVLAWLPLLVCTRWPVVALVGTVVVESVHVALLDVVPGSLTPAATMGAYQPVPLATMVAAYVVASRVPRGAGWAAGTAAGGLLAVVGVLTQPHDLLLTDLVVLNLVLITTSAGVAVSGRRERALRHERRRAQDRQEAVLDERLRIARELHDVLAHRLTLVNAQAGVAEYLLRTDPASAATALRDIAGHTGRALDELRATVGLLRHGEPGPDDDAPYRPVPGLDALDELVGSFRAAGARIEVETAGEPCHLEQRADLAAFRILQESLTNATKHAPGAPLRVRLEWSSTGLRLAVRNAAPAVAQPRRAGTGHGVIGMQERARAAGGTCEAGRTPGGGHEVVATLPAADPAGGWTA